MKRRFAIAAAIFAFAVCHILAAPGSRPASAPRTRVVWADDFRHNGSAIDVRGEVRITGRATGAGAYAGDGRLVFDGAFSPGNSPAVVTIAPQVVFTPSNILTMEIGGPNPGPGTPADNGYDKLIFTSASTPQITWGGTLVIQLFNSYTPAIGTEFDLFDFDPVRDAGTFSSIIIQDNGLLPLNSFLDTSALYTTGTVRIASTLTPIEQWRLLHFGITTDTGDAANLFDFDKDGTPNLIEYALGMHPRIPGTTGLPIVGKVNVSGSDYLTLTITRPLGATDVTYRFLVGSTPAATDEGSLYALSGNIPTNTNTTEHARAIVGQSETITVRDNTPITPSNSPRFMRLRIAHP